MITNFLMQRKLWSAGFTLPEETQKRLATRVNVEPLRTVGSTKYETVKVKYVQELRGVRGVGVVVVRSASKELRQ